MEHCKHNTNPKKKKEKTTTTKQRNVAENQCSLKSNWFDFLLALGKSEFNVSFVFSQQLNQYFNSDL